jgi:endonuclease III
MVDYLNITNFNRTNEELEEFLIFSILVAGKRADVTAKKLEIFLSGAPDFGYLGASPLDYLGHLVTTGQLITALTAYRLGQYNRLGLAFAEVLKFRGILKNISVRRLETVTGIGPKTARFFCLHSREDARHAVLDTHILHFMRDLGYAAPPTTPTGNKYLYWEQVFLSLCATEDKSPQAYDLEIWKKYSNNNKP